MTEEYSSLWIEIDDKPTDEALQAEFDSLMKDPLEALLMKAVLLGSQIEENNPEFKAINVALEVAAFIRRNNPELKVDIASRPYDVAVSFDEQHGRVVYFDTQSRSGE